MLNSEATLWTIGESVIYYLLTPRGPVVTRVFELFPGMHVREMPSEQVVMCSGAFQGKREGAA